MLVTCNKELAHVFSNFGYFPCRWKIAASPQFKIETPHSPKLLTTYFQSSKNCCLGHIITFGVLSNWCLLLVFKKKCTIVTNGFAQELWCLLKDYGDSFNDHYKEKNHKNQVNHVMTCFMSITMYDHKAPLQSKIKDYLYIWGISPHPECKKKRWCFRNKPLWSGQTGTISWT